MNGVWFFFVWGMRFVVGWFRDVDVLIFDSRVSREHVVLEWLFDVGWWFVDFGGLGGIWYDG